MALENLKIGRSYAEQDGLIQEAEKLIKKINSNMK